MNTLSPRDRAIFRPETTGYSAWSGDTVTIEYCLDLPRGDRDALYRVITSDGIRPIVYGRELTPL